MMPLICGKHAMVNQFFITGTDTEVGKTVTSAILMLTLNSTYWKPIQAGSDDLATVKKLTGLSDSYFYPCCYALKASLSPDQAAKKENITIDLNHCVIPSQSSLIVEGAGGVYVPLNENQNMINLITKLHLPIIIVARGTLGTINHTLLTINTLRQKNLLIHGIVFCGNLNPENQKAIENWGKVTTLFHIPFFEELNNVHLKEWVHNNKHHIKKYFS